MRCAGCSGSSGKVRPSPSSARSRDSAISGHLSSKYAQPDSQSSSSWLGKPLQLAPGVDLTAYRIAQEALTNAIKHAGPTTAQLRVSFAPDAVEVEVLDQGRGGHPNLGGHGLVGMRERVELYRGTLEVGPRPNGGFRVHARLPVGPA